MILLNPRLLVAALALAAPNLWAQEELLWKVDNSTVSTSLVPQYAGWATPFTVKPREAAKNAASDPDAEAAARASAEAAAQAAARAKAEAAALKKAASLAASPEAVAADLSQVKVEGILQGPLGNSMLWQGKWIKPGNQLKVPVTLGEQMTKTLYSLEATDPLTGGFLRDKLKERLERQTSLNVTLSQITSNTVVFTDGRQNYKLLLSQPPL